MSIRDSTSAGLAVLFNPLDHPVKTDFELPLYYTGIIDRARISIHSGPSDDGETKNLARNQAELLSRPNGNEATNRNGNGSKIYQLDRAYRVRVPVEVPAQGHIWLLIEDAAPAGSSAAFIDKLRAGKKQTIVTMGTSLTGGGSKWVTPFAEWLREEFDDRANVINLGVGASASERFLPGRSGLDIVSTVCEHDPDAVFIEFAVNDAYIPYAISLSQSRKNLNRLIDIILKHHPETEIILQTTNSVMDVPEQNADAARTRPRLVDYYESYRRVARERDILLIDHYHSWKQLMTDDRAAFLKYVPDGIHPTQAGYRHVVMPELKKALLRTFH